MKHKYFVESNPQKHTVEFYANVPYRFGDVVPEDKYSQLPHWLLDFPINVLYTSCYAQTPDIAPRSPQPKPLSFYLRACYTADVTTFRLGAKTAIMLYRPSCESEYYVTVEIDRDSKCMWVRKYRGDHLIAEGSGTNYFKVMIQATCLGVVEDEPHTSEPHLH